MKYEENVLAFERRTDKTEETLFVLCNFAAVPYEDYRVGVSSEGKYQEIFNTDQKAYGGTGMVNPGVQTAKAEECDERPYSVAWKLPALSVVIFAKK